jgi:type IV pilus assembly protein PilC
MSGFYYRAVDRQGRLHSGRLASTGRSTLEHQLELDGLRLVRVADWRQWRCFGLVSGQPRYSTSALSVLTFHFAHLLRAGIPLLAALDELAALESRAGRRAVLRDIRHRVDQGEALSDALQVWPAIFDAQYVAVVAAGEASGQLAESFTTLERSLRWQQGVSQRLRTLLIYPAFAALLLLGVVWFLFGFVVPSLAEFLSANGQVLPWYTRVLLSVSTVAQGHGVVSAMVASLFLGLFLLLGRQVRACRYWRDHMLLNAGPLGRLFTRLMLARYTESAALLYRNGVELIDALVISERVVGNLALQHQLAQVRQQILTGSGFAEALARARWVPSTLIRLVAAGESAGALEQALMQASEQLHMSASHSVDRIESLINPVLLGIIGGCMLWVVISVVLPVYDAVMAVGVTS